MHTEIVSSKNVPTTYRKTLLLNLLKNCVFVFNSDLFFWNSSARSLSCVGYVSLINKHLRIINVLFLCKLYFIYIKPCQAAKNCEFFFIKQPKFVFYLFYFLSYKVLTACNEEINLKAETNISNILIYMMTKNL